jgi:hypothetical protein
VAKPEDKGIFTRGRTDGGVEAETQSAEASRTRFHAAMNVNNRVQGKSRQSQCSGGPVEVP